MTLEQEVQALRERVEQLTGVINAQRRVSLSALPSGMFLGQPVTVIVQVTDGRGVTIPDAPITLVLTWGRLRSITPGGVLVGETLALRTGADGTVRVVLLPPLVKDLYDNEQSALQSSIRLLNPDARTPDEMQKELAELVRQYRWEANIDLRQAVDAYFRQFYDAEYEPRYDVMSSWGYVESTLIAYVAGADGTQTQGSAVMTFSFKNWLPAWLESYARFSRETNPLRRQLRDAIRYAQDAPLLRNILYARTRDYVNAERGRVGEFVSRKVADTAVKEFVNTRLGKLPLETRVGLLPSADTASQTIRTSGANILSAVSKTEVKLEREITTAPRIFDPKFGGLIDRVTGIESLLATKVDQTALDDRFSGLADSMTSRFDELAASTDRQINQGLDQRFDQQLDQRLDRRLEERLGNVQQLVNELIQNRVSREMFPEFERQLTRQFERTLNTRIAELEIRFRDRMTAVQDDFTSRFSGLSTDLNTRFTGLETNVATQVRGLESTVGTRINGLETTVGTRIAGLETTIGTRFTGLETNVRTIEGKTNRIDTSVSTLEGSVRSIRTDLRGRNP